MKLHVETQLLVWHVLQKPFSVSALVLSKYSRSLSLVICFHIGIAQLSSNTNSSYQYLLSVLAWHVLSMRSNTGGMASLEHKFVISRALTDTHYNNYNESTEVLMPGGIAGTCALLTLQQVQAECISSSNKLNSLSKSQ